MRYIQFDAGFEFEDEDLVDATRRKQVFREIVKDIRGSHPTDVNGAIARAIEMAVNYLAVNDKASGVCGKPRG